MKKLVSVLLSLTFVCMMATTVFAANRNDIENGTEADMPIYATATLADPTYILQVPWNIDFGTVQQYADDTRYTGTFAIGFGSRENWNGKSALVTYEGSGPNGELQMVNDNGDVLPFHLREATTRPTWTGNIFSITPDESPAIQYARTIYIDSDEITAAGDFTGTMYFTVSFIEAE